MHSCYSFGPNELGTLSDLRETSHEVLTTSMLTGMVLRADTQITSKIPEGLSELE